MPTVSDSENVHDHGIVATAIAALRYLESQNARAKEHRNAEPRYRRTAWACNEVRQFLQRGAAHAGRESPRHRKARETLDAIERTTHHTNGSGYTESDALAIVWERIHAPVNKEKQEAMRDALLTELADCADPRSNVVCSTGRLMRVVDTLNVLDDAVRLRTSKALQTEMLQRASKVQEDYFQELGTAREREDFIHDRGDHSNRMRNRIERTLRREYVDTGLILVPEYDRALNGWLSAV